KRGLVPVADARRLEVEDLDGDAALRTDADRLVDRLEQVVRLRAHVCDVQAAIRRHRLRGLDQLPGRREVRGWIDQRRGNAERATLHRPAYDLAHAVQLRGIGHALA